MALYDDIRLALGPIIAMRERLTTFEQQVFDDAMIDVKGVCDDEDRQARITANMMLELEVALEDAEGGPGDASGPLHDRRE